KNERGHSVGLDIEILHKGQQRYAQHYSQHLQIASQLYGTGQAQQSLKKLVKQWQQIAHAQRWAAAHMTTSEEVAQMCIAYADVRTELLEAHQTIEDQRQWYEDALQAARFLGRTTDEARCLHYIGVLLGRTKEIQQALAYHEQALELLSACGDRLLVPRIFNHIGVAHWVLGDREQARHYYEESLKLCQEFGDSLEMANALMGLGYVTYADDQYEKAQDYYQQALTLFDAEQNFVQAATILRAMGDAAFASGDHEAARQSYQRSLELCETCGFERGIAVSLTKLAYAHRELGDLTAAAAFGEQSIHLLRKYSDFRILAMLLNVLGNIATATGNYAQAQKYYAEGRDICIEMGDKMGLA